MPVITDEELESRKKLKRVKDQIESVSPVGEKKVIDCPYCGLKNYDGDGLCCDTLRRAVIAILSGKRMEQIQASRSRYVN